MSSVGYRLKFVEAIKALSTNKQDFSKACQEWEFSHVTDPGVAGSCICTHDISVDYVIQHKTNGTNVAVGCDCIQNFFENDEVKKKAKKVLLNRKRRLEGKDPIKECKYCGKTIGKVAKISEYADKAFHRSCYNKDLEQQRLEEKNKKRLDWISKLSQMDRRFVALLNLTQDPRDLSFLLSVQNWMHTEG